MRLLISGGGTGGHVYPALAVLAQLEAAVGTAAADAQTDLLWIGSRDGVEATLVAHAEIPFASIQTGQLRGKSPLTMATNLARIGLGVRQALGILQDYQPDCCFVTGGYVCAPVALACRMRNIPILVYLPDMTPGLAVRSLSRLATRVAVSFEEVANFFGDKSLVTGYPVRPELLRAASNPDQTRRELRKQYSFQEELPLLLIFGGSQGSRSINRTIWSNLGELLPMTQILHITGTRDYPLLQAELPELPELLQGRYRPVAYLEEEMAAALVASDLVVARAGASTLGEFPIAGLPSVLVPLPISGGHQMPNALKLAEAGASRIVADSDLSDKLLPTLRSLLGDKETLRKMGGAAANMARPQAAYNIAQELVRLSKRSAQSQWNERYA